jgi:hypothetical protein
LVVCSLVAALPIAASAAKITLCTCDPLPTLLTQESQLSDDVQPNGTGDVQYEFVNLTGSLINDLVFSTTIKTGLSTTMLTDDGDSRLCWHGTGCFPSCAGWIA